MTQMVDATAGDRTTDAVVVRTTLTGTPLGVLWEGRGWRVVAEPVHWFDRRSWWKDAGRGGPLDVEVEVWRLDVVPARARRAEPRTVWLHQRAGRWSVARHLP